MGADCLNKKMMRLATNTQYAARAAVGQLAVLSDFHLRTNFSKPFQVLIEPTLRCPMACKFCSLPTDESFPRRVELGLDVWRRILRELHDYSSLITDVYIGGGEPFIRPDLCDLIEYAHEIGLRTRTLTIGAFCTPKICDRLIQSPMEWIKFSIHSADPSVHDELVGRHGTHSRALKAIRYLRSNGYEGKIAIVATVWKKNVSGLTDIVRMAESNGADGVFFRPLFGNTEAIRLFGEPTPRHQDCTVSDRQALVKAIDGLKEMKLAGHSIVNSELQLDVITSQMMGENQGLPGCTMMYESIYIRPNGDIEICGHMSLGTMGNVAHRSVKEVLSSSAAYDARHGISRACRCQGNVYVRKSTSEKLSAAMEVIRR